MSRSIRERCLEARLTSLNFPYTTGPTGTTGPGEAAGSTGATGPAGEPVLAFGSLRGNSVEAPGTTFTPVPFSIVGPSAGITVSLSGNGLVAGDEVGQIFVQTFLL